MKTSRQFQLFACAMTFAIQCMAQAERPISIVVPTAAGGGNDAIARVIAQKMAPLLNRPVIVENKAGANGAIASELVAKAIPDGNTLLFGYVATHAMNPALQRLRYDPVKDFAPVGLVGFSPTLMVTHPGVSAKDVKTLVRLLKDKPNSYSVASAGNGTAPHFAAELFKLSTQTSLLHIPYKGSAPAVTDTIAGQTQVMFPSLFTAVPFVKSGRLTALAVAGPKRSPLLPDVPTLKEQGVDGVDVEQWYALFAPANTPKEVVQKLNRALNQVLSDKDTVKRLEDHGADVETSTPEKLGELVRSDLAKWRDVVQKAQLKAD